MKRLGDYQAALLAAPPGAAEKRLIRALDDRGEGFAAFIVAHGLGPLWHERTGRRGFYRSRMQAEALFAAQARALREIDERFDALGIEHAIIKGSANRLLVYDNPAVRACFDIDVLVGPGQRVVATKALIDAGFVAQPRARSISREVELLRNDATIDLHWGLLREGRLRKDPTAVMLDRRRRIHDMWMLSPEDALFLLLVHPAFAKHLGSYDMGLHRVADLLRWLHGQRFDWPRVRSMLDESGVSTAAWATLRWSEMLSSSGPRDLLSRLMADLEPGRTRRRWIDHWLRNDLSDRLSDMRWVTLLGFSPFLHDGVGDVLRAASGRWKTKRREESDLERFRSLALESRHPVEASPLLAQ